MNYHNITKADMLNGDGLRVVLWVAGCSHHCPGCHNPQTWDCHGGIPFDAAAEEEIYEELNKSWCSGITFSGGDPLFPGHRKEVLALANRIKEKFPNKTIWMYTGFTYEELGDVDLSSVDVLVDGEFIKELNDNRLHWVGSSNQRILYLKEGKVVRGRRHVISDDRLELVELSAEALNGENFMDIVCCINAADKEEVTDMQAMKAPVNCC